MRNSPDWTNLKTTIKREILPLYVVNDQLVTFFVPIECLSAKICYSWSSDKFAKRATCEFFSALFLLLVGSGPKRSMPIEKLGSSSLVSSIFQIERKLHCSLTGRKLWSQVKKCSSHLIYARPCVNKDFVHSGSIGLKQGKHARYVIRDFSQRSLSANNSVIAGVSLNNLIALERLRLPFVMLVTISCLIHRCFLSHWYFTVPLRDTRVNNIHVHGVKINFNLLTFTIFIIQLQVGAIPVFSR